MSEKCISSDCKKKSLNGYRYCEDHVGYHLKQKQDESQRDADYFDAFDNCYGD